MHENTLCLTFEVFFRYVFVDASREHQKALTGNPATKIPNTEYKVKLAPQLQCVNIQMKCYPQKVKFNRMPLYYFQHSA